MPRDNISDLLAFVAVVREKSFTRAAAKLGVSQSSLSNTISQLEKRMDVRLVTRTTRSVSATELGAQLLQAVAPRLAKIEEAIAEVAEQGESPARLVRIAVMDHFAATVLWPRLARLVPDHPDLRLEMRIGASPSDSDQEEYDIGVRWGADFAEDRVALRVTPDCRMVIVGSPAYLASQALPHEPADLLRHNCITMQTEDGTSRPWELHKGQRKLNLPVSGQCRFNGVFQMRNAALSGNGLAFLPEDLVKPHVVAGQLHYVLEGWFPTFPGLHLHYARRRQSSKTIGLVVAALRAKPQAVTAYPPADVVWHL